MSKSLSDLYSCSLHSKNPEKGFEEYDQLVDKIYEEIKNSSVEREEDVVYDKNGGNTKIDIWGSQNNPSKVFVMIHGGYWMFGSRKKCLSIFDVAHKNGFIVVSIGYDYVNEKQKLSQTINQIINGVQFIFNRFPTAQTFIIAGHSVGAHLACQVITKVKNEKLKGAVLIAGIYQLQELSETDYGKQLFLTSDEAQKCSCNFDDLHSLHIPILATLCDFESPKLREQNLKLAETCSNILSKHYANEDHYSILTELRNPKSQVYIDFIQFLSKF